MFGAVLCALVSDVLPLLVVHPGFYAGYHMTLRLFEPELLVEGVGSVVVYMRIETELFTPGVVCPVSETVKQVLCQSRSTIRFVNVDVTDEQSVGAVKDTRRFVDFGRDIPGKLTVDIGERSPIGESIDGDPCSIVRRIEAVDAEWEFRRDEVDVVGE